MSLIPARLKVCNSFLKLMLKLGSKKIKQLHRFVFFGVDVGTQRLKAWVVMFFLVHPSFAT